MTCQGEEILQSYVDGELDAEAAKETAAHLEACAGCAKVVREIESDAMFLSTTLEPLFPASVPTERLRARLDAALAAQSSETEDTPPIARNIVRGETGFASRLKSFYTLLTEHPRPAVAFASLVVALIVGAVFLSLQSPRTAPQVALNENKGELVASNSDGKNGSTQTGGSAIPATNDVSGLNADKSRNTIRKSLATPSPLRYANYARTNNRPRVLANDRNANNVTPADKLLPGEQSYLSAIASLTTVIEANKETALPPPVRAEYKRNLAVVDKAIAATRSEVRRNPGDGDAAEFLLAAYQSKLDLLDTFASAAR
ncbi:MAG: anti-sigma factor [Pyrinomonadaceae bacterium]